MRISGGASVPLDILDGIRSPNDELAILNVRRLMDHPCLSAVKELLELVENEGRSPRVNEAARLVIVKILRDMEQAEFLRAIEAISVNGGEDAKEILNVVMNDRSLRNKMGGGAPGIAIDASMRAIGEAEKMKDVKLPLGARVAAARSADIESAFEFVEGVRISKDPHSPEILKALGGSGTLNPELRAKAMEELARGGDEGAIPFFEEALGDEAPRIRHQAVFSLTLLWTDSLENRVEEVLGKHLGEETDRLLRLEIIDWLGKNAQHTAAKRALLGITMAEEDAGIAAAAERAAEELGSRLDARPSRFQSGAGIQEVTLPPEECEFGKKPSWDRPTDTNELVDENLAPDILKLATGLHAAREPRERLMLGRAIAMVAKMTMDRSEAEAVERILVGEGRGAEFEGQILEVRKKIEALKGAERMNFGRPSKRPTPPAETRPGLLDAMGRGKPVPSKG